MFILKTILFQSIQKYVKEQVLQVVAIICKRGILENSRLIQESLLRDITQLLSSNNRELVSAKFYRESLLWNFVYCPTLLQPIS